jgi:predicted HNH restriction endonuclease
MGNNSDKKIVLTEEVYTLCLSYIIERDFYSNLNQLQDKLSQICTELEIPYEQGDNLLNFLLNSEYRIDLNLNLDTFLSIYTSEDNQSYEKIVEKYELKRNELIKKLEQVNSKQLRIEDKEPQDLLLIKDNEYKKVEGWKYKAQNSLILLPDTKFLNANNSQLTNTRAAHKQILYNNTRLDDVQVILPYLCYSKINKFL